MKTKIQHQRKLKKDEALDIYDRSEKQIEINEEKDWLYRIKTKKGEEGWIFGKNIRVEYPIERYVGEKTKLYKAKADKLELLEKLNLSMSFGYCAY